MIAQRVRTVKRHNERIRNSTQQLAEYMKDPRIVNQQAFEGLYQNIEQVDVVRALRVFENKNSIVS